jgi:hypothetical protein
MKTKQTLKNIISNIGIGALAVGAFSLTGYIVYDITTLSPQRNLESAIISKYCPSKSQHFPKVIHYEITKEMKGNAEVAYNFCKERILKEYQLK